MGASPSTSAQSLININNKNNANDKPLLRSEEDVVKLMLPVYYTPHSIDAKERKLAVDSWNLIITAQSPEYLARKKTPEFPYASCLTFFYESFFSRLFDIHPMCRPLFRKGTQSQGAFIVKMISLALSELEDPEKFEKALITLAQVHYHRGVKAVEYGIVGEVLLWVFKTVLGTETYTASLHQAWLKIYCRMIRTIIPVASSLELNSGQSAAQTGRFNDVLISQHVATSLAIAAAAGAVTSTSSAPQSENSTDIRPGASVSNHIVSRS